MRGYGSDPVQKEGLDELLCCVGGQRGQCLEIPGVRMKAPGMEENLLTPAEAAEDLILIIHRKGNFYIQVEL